MRPSIRVGWTNLPSSRTKRKEQSDFEISCRGFNLHQAQEVSLLSLPYLVMNPGFRVSKTENDVTEEMVYVGDIRGGFSCFRFRCYVAIQWWCRFYGSDSSPWSLSVIINMSAALFKIKVQAKHKPTGLFETISSVRGHATAVAGQCGLNSKSL